MPPNSLRRASASGEALQQPCLTRCRRRLRGLQERPRFAASSGLVSARQRRNRCLKRNSALCRHRRLIALAVLLLAAVTVCRAAWTAPGNTLAWYGGRIGFSVYLYFTPHYRGRHAGADPSPRCCHGQACLPPADAPGRYAVATLLRTDQYVGLTQVCFAAKMTATQVQKHSH